MPSEPVSAGKLLQEIVTLRAEVAALQARELQAVAMLHDSPEMRPLGTQNHARGAGRWRQLQRWDLTFEELTAALHLSRWDARTLLDSALMLTTRLPRTLAALRAGTLDLKRASLIATRVEPLTDAHYRNAIRSGLSPHESEQQAARTAATIEDVILPRAQHQTPAALQDSVTAAIAVADPEFAEQARSANQGARDVRHWTNRGQGTGDIQAHLDAADAQAIYGTVHAYARLARHHGDPRTLAELRADALTHLVLNGHLPDPEASGGSEPVARCGPGTESTRTGGAGARPGDLIIPEVTEYGTVPLHPDACNTSTGDVTPSDTAPTGDADSLSDADPPSDAAPPSDSKASGGRLPSAPPVPVAAPAPGAAPAPKAVPEAAPAPGAVPVPASPPVPAPVPVPVAVAVPGAATGAAPVPGAVPVPASPPVPAPPRPGVTAHVQITVDLATLLGLNQDPGHLEGHGPVTAEYARALAGRIGSTWRRLVTDPVTGQLLNYGRTTYRPPAALNDHCRARDVTCRHPGCHRPAVACDLDHLIPYPVGQTSEDNLHARCGIHHRLKHDGRWRHELSTDPGHAAGTVVITSPAGRRYLSQPPALSHSRHPSARGRPEVPAAIPGSAGPAPAEAVEADEADGAVKPLDDAEAVEDADANQGQPGRPDGPRPRRRPAPPVPWASRPFMTDDDTGPIPF